MSNNQPPYHFVSNFIVSNEQKNKQLHDALLHNKQHNGTYSGEIQCELTTLTAAIFAGYQQTFDKADKIKKVLPDSLKGQIDSSFREKNLLFPLCYQERTVIAGSSIKGMIQHSISALTSQPMLQVQEQTYSYRPNIPDIPKEQLSFRQKETHPAIVTNLDPLSVKILETTDSNKTVNSKHFKYISATALNGSSVEAYIDNEKTFRYNGGIDNKNILSKARIKVTKKTRERSCVVEVPNNIKSSKNPIVIDKDIVEHYKLTTEHLINTTTGHISSRHPDQSKSTSTKELKESIEENRELYLNQLIFIEIDTTTEKITSFGNHYYYHWRYKDSIRMINASTQRAEVSLPSDESKVAYIEDGKENSNATPAKLGIVRSLFGFVDEKEDGTNQASNTKLAGRVSINHALEVKQSNHDLVLEENLFAVLEPTGSPKASAVEFYINQNDRQSTNLMNTYGDDAVSETASRLNGRKFYLHHDGNEAKWRTFTNFNEPSVHQGNLNNKLAPLVKGVSPENTQYRFSVNFNSLRDWELGLILAALQPECVWELLISDKEFEPLLKKSFSWAKKQDKEKTKHLGVKLGYGRPFGFGSCDIQTTPINAQNHSLIDKKSLIQKALKHFSSPEFDQVLVQWMKVHNLNTGKMYSYPKAGKYNNTFGFHSGVRQKHTKNRRLQQDRQILDPNARLADLD